METTIQSSQQPVLHNSVETTQRETNDVIIIISQPKQGLRDNRVKSFQPTGPGKAVIQNVNGIVSNGKVLYHSYIFQRPVAHLFPTSTRKSSYCNILPSF